MKWMIASDLHGSAFYTELLLSRFEALSCERLLLLGDLLYHGPRNDLPKDYRPKEVIRLLSDLKEKIFCVRGNCEAEVDQMVLPFPVLAEYCLIPMEQGMIFATHGHHYHIGCLPPLKRGDILLYGHTHVPLLKEKEGVICMNPGSVSIPKEQSPAGFLLFDGDRFSYRRLDDASEYGFYDRKSGEMSLLL